jgi:hypothetical protein
MCRRTGPRTLSSRSRVGDYATAIRVRRREIGVGYFEHHAVHTVARKAGRPHEGLTAKTDERIRLARQPPTEDPILDLGLLEVSASKQIVFRAVQLTPACERAQVIASTILRIGVPMG